MSDEPKPTWTEREIVLEMFPATDARLVPDGVRYRVQPAREGRRYVVREGEGPLLDLTPVPGVGNPLRPLCCDLCRRTGDRRALQLFRAEMPGSGGRRFRYLTACRDVEACEARRQDDHGIERLLRLGGA